MRPTNPYENIGGLAEVAELLGRPKQTVRNWIIRNNQNTPKPLATMAATPIWSLTEWRSWAKSHSHLVNWEGITDPVLSQWARVHPHRVQGD